MSADRFRTWLRFDLRVLFLIVTLICCWLGWQLSIVRQRAAKLAELKTNPMIQFVMDGDPHAIPTPPPPGSPTPVDVVAPVWRMWLGDVSVQRVYYWPDVDGAKADEMAELRARFPEAEFQEVLPEPCHPGCFPRGTFVATPAVLGGSKRSSSETY
ncbi:MAG: hypothetical protein QM811_00945 [Pirellulales bacterium]